MCIYIYIYRDSVGGLRRVRRQLEVLLQRIRPVLANTNNKSHNNIDNTND